MKRIIKAILLSHTEVLRMLSVGIVVICTILLVASILAGNIIPSILMGISWCLFLIHALYSIGVIKLNGLNSKVIDLAQFEFKSSTVFEDLEIDLKRAEKLNDEYEKFIVRSIKSKKFDSLQLGTLMYSQGRYVTAKDYLMLLMLSYLNLGNSKERTTIAKLLNSSDKVQEIIKSLKSFRESDKGKDKGEDQGDGKYSFL